MCISVRLNNGQDLETVEQFVKHFRLHLNELRWPEDETEIITDACLCQIDVDKYLKTRPDFEYESGDWWEKPERTITYSA